ncbi:glycerate kinase [Desertibacillus haloalkaliphilus]|uniref:glycerate kinase n=1 Tax=Desertibacillus haloalkaliphilus TaxID=1328930 RepID=UPI001C25E3F7|nr:glycerate kinase [Desertibacillus haloalkaliphilus]MBU8906856.1 glycerate kinase [Desertibacillus haloalkaliphilus]
MVKVVVAPDSFKGSLTALEVAEQMKLGVKRAIPEAEVEMVPVADGGEGTMDTLVHHTYGEQKRESVEGPLGDPVEAKWGILGDKETAVIEMAEASGFNLVSSDRLNPLQASTYGTGQLIKCALDYGCKRLLLAIGGSATNDGGAGMATALGVKLFDEAGVELKRGGAQLKRLHSISIEDLDPRLRDVEVVVASDVTNPLCGPNGASFIFGPQKGATDLMVEQLDQALSHYAAVVKETVGKDVKDLPGAGAAGGLGAGLIAFLDAGLQPGVDLVLDVLGFDEKVNGASLVLTGEGKTDEQTSFGKVPMGVGLRAKQKQVPVICISGSLDDGYKKVAKYGVDAFFSITDRPQTLDCAMERADQLVAETVEQVISVYCLRGPRS